MSAVCSECDSDLVQDQSGYFRCELCELKTKFETLKKENDHLRKVNGIKLKRRTIKQSLIYAHDEISELKSLLEKAKNSLEEIAKIADKSGYVHEIEVICAKIIPELEEKLK